VKKVNILLLQETDWDLRGPHQQHHLMERLSVKGHEIKIIDYEFLWKQAEGKKQIFTPKRIKKGKAKIIEESKITVVTPGMIKLPFFNYLSIPVTHFAAIYKEITNFKPDIIIGFGIINSFIGLRLAKRFGIPYIYYLIDHLHTLIPIRSMRFLAKALESYNIRNCDKIFVINTGLLDYAIELGGNLEKVICIPGGVDFERYSNNYERTKIREKLRINSNDIVLMFMGWIYDFSGMKELTDYICENEDDIPNIRLLLVGKGDLFDYIQTKREKLKNHSKIIMTGQVPFSDIPKYLQCADYCLLPAHKNEIMKNIVPIKLYEYLAAGKPVISTRLEGVVKEFGYNNGIIYIEEPIEVFKTVNEILDKNDEIVKQGQDFVSSYDWNKIIKRFENEVKLIIKEYPKTS
jgi:glycosyltransferase involved in cell wall biosynthesis